MMSWRTVTTIAAAAACTLAFVPALGGALATDADVDPAFSADELASVAADHRRVCAFRELPITLEPGTPLTPGDDLGLPLDEVAAPLAGDLTVFAKVCLPRRGPGAEAVQVLTHGITYDHRYWNIADPDDARSQRYSWEGAAARAGYATIAIDRIGNGRSTHPLSAFVDISTNAAALGQVVDALHAGTIQGPEGEPFTFDDVVLVGHSYGSMTSFTTADGREDLAAIVLTGVSHAPRPVDAPVSIFSQHYPAVLDDAFADEQLDPGYWTSRPGTRRALFYSPGTDVDERIIARDEATKGTFSQAELSNFPIIFATVKDLRAPVLYVNGALDGIFCSQEPLDQGADCSTPETLIANERPWLGDGVPSIDAIIVDNAGHDLNAFRGSKATFHRVMHWLDTTLDD